MIDCSIITLIIRNFSDQCGHFQWLSPPEELWETAIVRELICTLQHVALVSMKLWMMKKMNHLCECDNLWNRLLGDCFTILLNSFKSRTHRFWTMPVSYRWLWRTSNYWNGRQCCWRNMKKTSQTTQMWTYDEKCHTASQGNQELFLVVLWKKWRENYCGKHFNKWQPYQTCLPCHQTFNNHRCPCSQDSPFCPWDTQAQTVAIWDRSN